LQAENSRVDGETLDVVLTCCAHTIYVRSPLARTREKQSGLPIGEAVLGLRRFASHQKLFCASLNFAIRDTHTLVLAQVLDPRFVHEAFHEARGIFRVVK
jgi:hypothetical protein